MTAIVLVENREAIPVRAIPFVTGWQMPPDLVASSLAHRNEMAWETLLARHLLPDGHVADMLPKEWDAIERQINSLTKELRARETFPRQTWDRESVRLLPAGCFVWRDEFTRAYQKAYSPRNRFFLDTDLVRDERVGERELNFTPLIQDVAPVMEGFRVVAVKPPQLDELDQNGESGNFENGDAAEQTQATVPAANGLPGIKEGLSLSDAESIEATDFGRKQHEEIQREFDDFDQNGEPSGVDKARVETWAPVSAAVIKSHFVVFRNSDENHKWWTRMMRNASDNGLKKCRVGEGRKGRGGSDWRPDCVAGWLVDRNENDRNGGLKPELARKALKKFPGYSDRADELFPAIVDPDQLP